jgi:potassium-transporting ATPase potassium-binding subunit
MDSLFHWLQMGLFLALLLFCVKPMGIYLSSLLNPAEPTFLDPLIKPLEQGTYSLFHIDPMKEQTWVQYLFSILIFSLGSLIFTMAILFLQFYLPFNHEKLGAPSWPLIWNTAVSFVTNTNWQSYAGETTFSHFSKMAALAVQNFLSPAVSLAVSATLVRSLSRNESKTVGNFWTDLVRTTYYLFLPLAILFAIVFLSEGVPQNFSPPVQAETLEGAKQIIAQGPIASQEAIKLLGTNGGGFFNANSAHPYENPTPLSSILQLFALLIIPAGQIYYFGREVNNKKHVWSIIIALSILVLIGIIFCTCCETWNTPQLSRLGLEGGNMEGKELRFGIGESALYATLTTCSSCGSVCSMHDSFTPLGGMVPLFNMFTEMLFGGSGSGLYNILLYMIITIFFAGLIIGRIPEYLGNKIEAREIKLTVVALLIFGMTVLGMTAWAAVSDWGLKGLGNGGPHGFSEILYAYTSTAANNGSAFAGLSSNTTWYNLTLSISMLIGRFAIMTLVLALAGSIGRKKKIPHTPTDLVVHGVPFILLYLGVVIVFGALMFLPALVMGPILEQYFMMHGLMF